MKSRKIEILIEEILKVVKRIYNKLEKIKEKINILENRMLNIEIQQNTLISVEKDPKYVRGTIEKIVEQRIFRKYPERTMRKEDIEKGSLVLKLNSFQH